MLKKIFSIPGVYLILLSFQVSAQEMWFNPQFIKGQSGQLADLQSLINNQLSAGEYLVKVYVNDEYRNEIYIKFDGGSLSGSGLTPCMNREIMKKVGLSAEKEIPTQGCVNISEIITDATAHLDVNQLTLRITVPQSYMNSQTENQSSDGADEGINAAFMKYYLSAQKYSASSNFNGYFNEGVNISGWRIRQDMSTGMLQYHQEEKRYFRRESTYAEKQIPLLRSQLTVGDSFTDGSIFRGVVFQGVKISSDNSMLSPSRQYYSPAIRGVSRGSGKMKIYQNGRMLDVRKITPGEYDISDLSLSGGGDILVIIEYDDGTSEQHIIPCAYLPVMVHPGVTDSTLTAGKISNHYYRNQTDADFLQEEIKKGLSDGTTLYAGGTLAGSYYRDILGLSRSFSYIGAVSLDSAHSHFKSGNFIREGDRVRIRLAKRLFADSDVSLSYENSPGGRYSDLGDISYPHRSPDEYGNYELNKHSETEINYRLPVASYAQLSVMKRWTAFSNDRLNSSTTSINLSSYAGRASVGISLMEQKFSGPQPDDRLAVLNFSIPFQDNDPGDTSSHSFLNSSLYSDRSGKVNNSTIYSGNYPGSDRLSYNAGVINPGSHDSGSSFSASWAGTRANSNVNYSATGARKNYGAQISGAFIAADHHVLALPALGETNIIVETDSIDHVSINGSERNDMIYNQIGLVTSANEYRNNKVIIDYTGNDDRINFDNRIAYITPSRGAFGLVKFRSTKGLKVIFHVTSHGADVPFASEASEVKSGKKGLVDDTGILYMDGLPEAGEIKISWGQGEFESCTGKYDLTNKSPNIPIKKAYLQCF